MEADKASEKIKKRKRADVIGYVEGENVDSDLENDQMHDLKRKLKDVRSN